MAGEGKGEEASDFHEKAFFTTTEVSIQNLTTAIHKLLVGVGISAVILEYHWAVR